jgi:type II secretory pathway pseudopilin PulG
MNLRAHSLPLHEERGFSLLELLVASAMSVLVVGGMLLMLDGLRDIYRDQSQLIDAQMTARLALERMQRDIELAGIGLLGMLSPLPVIEPRDDGGIDVRYNSGNVTARMSADAGASHFVVDDVSGFEVGMEVVAYDGTGAFDLLTLTTVEADNLHLHYSGIASKTYKLADGAAVKRVQTTSYRLETVNDVFWLQRQQDSDPVQPVALNVRSMNIVYYDDANPPAVFTPVTLADQLRVNIIEVKLVVETEDVRLNTTQERTVTLTRRITPRSAILAS